MSRSRWTVDNPGIVEGDGDPRHGTHNGYGNLKCRCDACREANSEWYANGPGAALKWAYRARLVERGKTTGAPARDRVQAYVPRPSARHRKNISD